MFKCSGGAPKSKGEGCVLIGLRIQILALVVAAAFGASTPARAADGRAEQRTAPSAKNPDPMRNFYTVLEDLVSDFEYDLKNGQVSGLRDLSIRNLAVNELVPASFKSHLELVITERLLKAAKVRMIQCLPCRARKTVLSGDQMVISGPETNPAEMSRIARQSGIQNFMDVAFAYQPTGMMLSIQISDAETGTTVWTRNYNSENTRLAAQRRGVDYQESDEAKIKMEYSPTVAVRPIIYTLMAPKAANSGYSTSLGLGLRVMERYDNRHKEVGFEMNYYLDVPKLVGITQAPSNVWAKFNLTMLFMHAWGLFGDEENYNQTRGVIHAGVGGTYASGLLGGLVRGGYEWRFAKHWVLDAFVGYRPKATVLISGSTSSLVGVEGGLGVGFNF